MADQRRFDWQFEFMVLIIGICFVVLQTWPVRNEIVYFNVIISDTLHTHLHSITFCTHKLNWFTVWGGRAGRRANPGKCCKSELFPAGGAVFWVGPLAPADQPLCSGNNTVEENILKLKKCSKCVDLHLKVIANKIVWSSPSGLELSILHLRKK